MGLHTDGNKGVKAQLKMRYPQAFKDFESLVDARNASLATREQAFSCIDGNVLMMAVPKCATTLDSYIAIVFSSLKRAIATTKLTVVVFDDPDTLTEAKLTEQLKRDAARSATTVNSSDDLRPSFQNDDYTKENIESISDVHELVFNRGSRLRFFDEVAMNVMERLKEQIKKWNESGYDGGYVVFDGIDPRGADRGIGEARTSGIVASSDEAASLFQRDDSIGEGDLKLAFVGRTMRNLALMAEDGLFKDTRLGMCTTIDTDSFAIELIEESKRNCATKPSPVNTLLCMRERAQKRGADGEREAYYLCCDVALLHQLLQRHMWGMNRNPTAVDQRSALTLLVAGWGLCGCDFVSLKGMRSDVVFDCIPEIVKTQTDSVCMMRNAWAGDRQALSLTHRPIKDLLSACASKLVLMPRIKKNNVTGIRDPDDVVLRQTGWLTSYWNGVEHKGCMEDFGFLKPFS